MKKNLKFASLVIILAAAALSGCKDDDDTTYLTLSGSLSFRVPDFVPAGYTQSIKLSEISTVYADDGTEVGHYFSYRSKIDTASGPDYVYTFVIPDTLASLSVTCTAFAKGYYGKSYSGTMVVVDPAPGKSLTGIRNDLADGSFELDGNNISYQEFGDSYWTMVNLPPTAGKGESFNGYELLSTILGGYFTWGEAQSVCPDGWRLPSDEDWSALAKHLGGEAAASFADFPGVASKMLANGRLNGDLLWDTAVFERTDTTGFSALPAGYATVEGPIYKHGGAGTYAAFWTSDEYEGKGVYRYISYSNDMLYAGTADKTGFAASVRCIKNKD